MISLNLFEFPISLILALAFVLLVCLMGRMVPSFFKGRAFCSGLMALSALLIAVEGTFGGELHHHWSFVVVAFLLMLSTACAVAADWKTKSLGALLSHAGLFLVLLGGLFGASDCEDAQMRLYAMGPQEHMAIDKDGRVVSLPFSVSLKDFSIEYYEDGASPKQYVSTISVDGRDIRASVNHPARFRGYRIYQSGYGNEGGSYSILKIVRDPWLPVVALGAMLLVLAAFAGLKTAWDSWKMLLAALVLAAAFALISVYRIKFGTLMPALRSLWFVPHVIVYMLAYSTMALSVIACIVSFVSPKVPKGLSHKLFSTSSSLLLLGMVCGAVWAKQAWGDYWTWDPKECWAAATWLLTLAGTHARKEKLRLVLVVLSFLAIQMTWYGVNYLPSSSQSMHTYNR